MYFDIPTSALNLLIPLYNSPQRHYHNLGHIHFGLSKIDEYTKAVGLKTDDHQVVTEAFWFHDAVYSPFPWSSTSNEKESALLFQKWWIETYYPIHISKKEMKRFDLIFDKITEAILATEYHLKMPENFKLNYETSNIVLDVDMAGFARSFSEVYSDSEKIFKEYEALGLSKQTMLQNRIAFLEKLLQKDRIYHTDYFYDTHERAARSNIEAVIEVSKTELDK